MIKDSCKLYMNTPARWLTKTVCWGIKKHPGLIPGCWYPYNFFGLFLIKFVDQRFVLLVNILAL